MKLPQSRLKWAHRIGSASLPMVGEGTCINEHLEVNGERYKITCLSMGNPHCVTFVDNLDAFPVCEVGSQIENHKAFPKRTNVGFAHIKAETR
jgi:diaminopimelate epimerase